MAGQILPFSAGVGVTAIVWGRGTMGEERIVCVCLCTDFAAILPTLSNHSGRSDISGNFHWCGTGAPAVKTEQQGGVGWGEMSSREKESGALDVAYQTWQDLAALWFVGDSTDKLSLSLPFFLRLCALLLSVVEWMIASLWCWQHEIYLPEWHWFLFSERPNVR